MSTKDPHTWVKAAASAETGNCVEQRVARPDGRIEVRDTKQHGRGPTLRLAPAVFRAWVDAAKQGELG
ncbi:DUF397 domain-containing protein [Kineosporia sp. J2-2]|uniref:DUF397 domain-containing protein n=1 Tax=Kineosporia corallincola TaxID=2835133 RepID=A0ABS5TKJ7_9ACTN|nr:DUF397 domain-containing protein [Kineosporia corallincola]MBT0771634.1 DUF397 domain-containing protein [Kineosporia corallincola]